MDPYADTPEPQGFKTFGLISGTVSCVLTIIGLVADLITISSQFNSANPAPAPQINFFHVSSFSIWLFYLFFIAYTVLIFSYFIRRRLVKRRKRTSQHFSYEKEQSLERGIFVLTSAIGLPLFIFHLILLLNIIQDKVNSLDSEQLQKTFGTTDATGVNFWHAAHWVLLDPLFSLLLCIVLTQLASVIYSALEDD